MELDYKDIGSRIAARRKKLGLKQSEVEERAKIGYKYLSEYRARHFDSLVRGDSAAFLGFRHHSR